MLALCHTISQLILPSMSNFRPIHQALTNLTKLLKPWRHRELVLLHRTIPFRQQAPFPPCYLILFLCALTMSNNMRGWLSLIGPGADGVDEGWVVDP